MVRRYFAYGLTPASVNGFHFLGLTESNRMSIYPTELIAKAEFEMRIFERVSQETGKQLLNEVKSLRAILQELSECPFDIDQATVSKNGLEWTMQNAPNQVAGNMSVRLSTIRKVKSRGAMEFIDV
jgi:hypothetical protein